jgi:hypothetical protein
MGSAVQQILRNCVFKLQNSYICAVLGDLFADCQEWRLEVVKRTDMSSAILKGVRFADDQESRFHCP